MEIRYELHWGLIAGPISKQLEEQNIILPPEKAKYVDRLMEAHHTLMFVLPDGMNAKIWVKCNNKVNEIVEKYATIRK